MEQSRQRTEEPKPAYIKNLAEMGFPEERAKKALVHFKNNFNLAMDYLINNDPVMDVNLRGNNESTHSRE